MQPEHQEQPMPVRNDRPSIQGMVRDDLAAREQVGIERYGTPLQAANGRDAMRDAYEEALDLATYLRQVIEERSLAVDLITEALDQHRVLDTSVGRPGALLGFRWECRCGWAGDLFDIYDGDARRLARWAAVRHQAERIAEARS